MTETTTTAAAVASSGTGTSTGTNDGYKFRWSRLSKSVQIREATSGLLRSSIAAPTPSSTQEFKKTGGVTKCILNKVSGSAMPGQVLALMGPSGSGKTTLLNILSGRSSYGSGVITINGDTVSGVAMKRLMSKIAYVKQSDLFFEDLTVRDQLTYTALLRLPSSMDRSRKHQAVSEMLDMLRLGKVSESPIKLVSGGEKKRVNIGTELLTDPKVLLLDEPTSGLDSTSAVALLKLLQQLARTQSKTVITSIHQPSSAVFRSFDRLMMLAEGNCVYFGTPAGSLAYLREQNLSCPEGYNGADYWMDLLVRDTMVEADDMEVSLNTSNTLGVGNIGNSKKDDDIEKKASPRSLLIQEWDNEAVATEIDEAVQTENKSEPTMESQPQSLATVQKYNTGWATQFGVLTHRCLKNSRSAIFTPLNLIKSAALGVIAGLLWFQLENTERNVQDRSSFFFFAMTFWVFDAMFTSLMSFPSERSVILKERASASYHLSAYFAAKTLSEAPTRLSLPFIFMTISFWMADLNPRFTVFVGTTGCTLLSVLAGESIGLFVGASIYDLQKALTFMTVGSLGLMLMGGFFVQNIPSFLVWGKYLSPFKYSFDASRQLVFDRDVPCDGSGDLQEYCGGRDTGFATADQVREFLAIDGGVGFNVGMLLLIIIIPRYVAYLALRSKKSGDRS